VEKVRRIELGILGLVSFVEGIEGKGGLRGISEEYIDGSMDSRMIPQNSSLMNALDSLHPPLRTPQA
jgi:hypothetical protein